jgi:hypothetical protein
MIHIKNTPNYAGVTVTGDHFDFQALYDALHNIVGDEEEWSSHEGARLRVLGVCYDLRHSLMGNREIEFVDNGLDQDKMRYLSIVSSTKNLYLSFNVLWPELLFVTMALNEFIVLYAKKHAKNSYKPVLDYHNIWDESIAFIRQFQAIIARCIKETVPETSYSRIIKMMNYDYMSFSNYATQYLDELNCKFIDMDQEKRFKNITIMAKRLAEQGKEYQATKIAVLEAARKYNCHMTNIKSLKEYPETIDW